MNIIITKTKAEVDKLASQYLLNLIKNKSDAVLGLATGSSMIGVYQYLVNNYEKDKTDWSDIITFNLDEYVGLEATSEFSYAYFMNQHLFNFVNIKKTMINIPAGLGDPIQICQDYNQKLKAKQIDLQILGLGVNGHIAFNEPPADFASVTHVTDLTVSTIEANKVFFNGDKTKVPTQAITMGIASIMASKQIVLVADGTRKAAAVKNLIEGGVDVNNPCSILQNHPNTTIIIDNDAASLLTKKDYWNNNYEK